MNFMNDKVFIDTNLFVYAKLDDDHNTEKREQLEEFFKATTNEIIISTRVINEFYSAMLKNKVSDEDIQEMINQILIDVEVSIVLVSTIKLAWELKKKYKLSFWDSLIVSAALESGCEMLYSEDLQHNQLINDKLTIKNPLLY